MLKAMGCDTVQGFAFGSPMAEADYRVFAAGSTASKTAQSVA
jgi:EAL domain-containing protein (putative c-di-GMP-specific phosphodiesterase class I)